MNWENIDSALSNLIIHEEGFRFQRLAVSLAKQRWPQLVAPEIRNDGGEDAFLPMYFESDGKHYSVGCSITADYSKIKSDVKKIVDRRAKIDLFIFYTPQKVPLSKGQKEINSSDKWGQDLKHEFGCDLFLVTREDIIQELLKPDNHWMCREFLGMDVPYVRDIQSVISRVKQASQEVISQWRRTLISDVNLIELRIQEKCDCSYKDTTLFEIAEKLISKDRFILYGLPGSGKSTTLIQIAQRLIDVDHIPILLSFPDVLFDHDTDILNSILRNPVFESNVITREELLNLHKSGKLVFLLNGWNEISPEDTRKASILLSRIDREYTASGIIVASRTNISLPLRDASELNIKDLDRVLKKEIIRNIIPDEWETIFNHIQSSYSLSHITRTPLFLVELLFLYRDSKVLPETRARIFEHVVRKIEENSEHAAALRLSPISGRSEDYLIDLSQHMIQLGHTSITYDEACSVITSYSNHLNTIGRISLIPDPNEILNILCNHHLLVKSGYRQAVVQFVHQQFLEYYAYLYIKTWFNTIVESNDPSQSLSFQKEIINVPIWEEPLLFLTEELAYKISNEPCPDALRHGELLIRMTLYIDHFLAARLVHILGITIWDLVKDDFENHLRKIYQLPDKNHKACALSSMFATGSDAFGDIIMPLLQNFDNQVRLSTYRHARPLYVSCLGIHWKTIVNKWSPDRRAEFLSELSINPSPEADNIFFDYLKNDPDIKVRIQAIESISWCCSRELLNHALEVSDDDTFKMVIGDEYILAKLSDNLRRRALPVLEGIYKDISEPRKRIKHLINIQKHFGIDNIAEIKKEMDAYVPDKKQDTIREILKFISLKDPNWTSEWLCKQIAKGLLYYSHFSDYIAYVPESLIEGILTEYVSDEYPVQSALDTKYLIAKGASETHASFLLAKIIELESKYKGNTRCLTESESNLHSRLRDVVRLLPLSILVPAVLNNYPTPNCVELNVILNLFGSFGVHTYVDMPTSCPDELRDVFRAYLLKCYQLVFEQEDYSGTLKANIACALAHYGQPADIALIKVLIEKDIERKAHTAKAIQKRDLDSPWVRYGRTGWAHKHIEALMQFDSELTEKILFELLYIPEYECRAANGLLQLLMKKLPKEKKQTIPAGYLRLGADTWRERHIDPRKKIEYAQVITNRIHNILQKDCSRAPKHLAKSLARFNNLESIPLILDVLSRPGKFDAFVRVDTLEILIRNGHCLPTKNVIDVIAPAIKDCLEGRISGDQEEYLLVRCLCVLVCTNDIELALKYVDDTLSKQRMFFELRPLISTLGHVNSAEAAKYLVHLCNQKQRYGALTHELILALGSMDVHEAKQALLSTLDNTITSHKIPFPKNDFALSETLSSLCSVDDYLYSRIISLCNNKDLIKQQKATILSIFEKIPSNEAILASLSMFAADSASIPYPLQNCVEMSIVQHVAVDDHPGSYNIMPKSNIELITALFEMRDNMLALNLLGYINYTRLEHGRPPLEPRVPDIRTCLYG